MCGIYLFNIAWEEAHKHDAPTLFVHLLRQQKPSSVLFKGAKREMITTKNPPLPLTLQLSHCSPGREHREGPESRDRKGL